MNETSIAWTNTTWNPTTGCDRTSPGCDNCYALTLAKRLKAMGSERYQNDGDARTSGPGFRLTLHDDLVDAPHGWRQPRLVFVNSMSDLFHDDVDISFIQRVFGVMRETPRHTYQVLTKRTKRLRRVAGQLDWPPNVWMGVSVENARYRFRIDDLRNVPAAVRFISAEPLLGPLGEVDLAGIDWVIVGGESGPGARRMPPQSAALVIARCRELGVAPFFKQTGSVLAREWGMPGKGEDLAQIPEPWREVLDVREWPASKTARIGEMAAAHAAYAETGRNRLGKRKALRLAGQETIG